MIILFYDGRPSQCQNDHSSWVLEKELNIFLYMQVRPKQG